MRGAARKGGPYRDTFYDPELTMMSPDSDPESPLCPNPVFPHKDLGLSSCHSCQIPLPEGLSLFRRGNSMTPMAENSSGLISVLLSAGIHVPAVDSDTGRRTRRPSL